MKSVSVACTVVALLLPVILGCSNVLALDYTSSNSIENLSSIWNRTWQESGASSSAASILVHDSALYVLGNSIHSFILKYDIDGNCKWNKSITNGVDGVSSFAVDSSNIIAVGGFYDFEISHRCALILRYDTDGNFIMKRTWRTVDQEAAYAVVVRSSNIYVAGQVWNYTTDASGSFLLKYDFYGNLIWERTWFNETASVMVRDGSYLYVSGWTKGNDLFLRNYGLDGEMRYDKTYNLSGAICPKSIAVDGSSIYIGGNRKLAGIGDMDAIVIKLDNEGNLKWNRTWGDVRDDWIGSIHAYNSKIYGAGFTNSDDSVYGDMLIVKYDANGTLLWNMTWGNASAREESRCIDIDDSGIYIAGQIQNYGHGNSKVVILKLKLDEPVNINNDSPNITIYLVGIAIIILVTTAAGIIIWSKKK